VGSNVAVFVGIVGEAVSGTGDLVQVAGNLKGVSVAVGMMISCGTITGRMERGSTLGWANTMVKIAASAKVPINRMMVRIFQAVSFMANPFVKRIQLLTQEVNDSIAYFKALSRIVSLHNTYSFVKT
jgi:hypothetical protein